MSDTTRDSYQDSKNYVEVTFQRNKDVLDSELNELQRILRSTVYDGLRAVTGSSVLPVGIGGSVTADGVAVNTIKVEAGIVIAGGTALHIPTDITVTGLTTPGVPSRVDYVYAKLEEDEVNSGSDSFIAVAKLGETTVRKRVRMQITVVEGSATPPTTTNPPHLGGVSYFLLATIYRSNVGPTPSIVEQSNIHDMRGILGEHGHHACAWREAGGTATFTGSVWTPGSAVQLFSSLDYLQPGDFIDSITWHYTRGGAGSVKYGLGRRQVGGSNTMLEEATDSSTTPAQTITSTKYSGFVVESGYSYYLMVTLDNVAQIFDQAIVYHRRLKL